MPQVGLFFYGLGSTIAAGFGFAGTLAWGVGIAIGAVALAVGIANARRAAKANDQDRNRDGQQLMVRSTEAPRNICYGETHVGGVLTYGNTAGSEQSNLYYEIVHAGHEIDSFVGWFLDDKFVPATDLSGGAGADVDDDSTGHGLGPIGTTPVMYLRGALGTAAQAVDSFLDADFTEIDSNHRQRGCARTVMRADFFPGAEDTWNNRAPGNVTTVMKAKKVYDPRLDTTFPGGSGAHRLATPSTWAWSDNPALIWADYRITPNPLGPGWASSRINYQSVFTAANHCDATVAIPTAATEKRFRCDLTADSSMEPREVIDMILASMAGTERQISGQWHVFAGVWPTPDFDLDEDDLIGPIQFRREPETNGGERFNQVKGQYLDRDRQWKLSPFSTVTDTTLRTNRDNWRTFHRDLELRGVSREYQAQRLAFRALNQADDTGVLVFPMGYQGSNIRVGDTGTVSLAEFGWANKSFRCIALKKVAFVGVELTLKEDSEGNYDDPAEGDYGTRTAAGAIEFPASPDNLSGVVRDPMFARELGESWIVSAGAGVSIQVGGGEGGGNALQLTNAASTTQAAYNSNMFNTAPGEVIGGQMRVQKTADVTSVIVRTSYYRRDTLALIDFEEQDVTARIATNGAYYTVAWRQHTPTTYTLDDDLRMKARLEIRMVPDGSGTATATVSSFNADRIGIVGTNELDPETATSSYTETNAAATNIALIGETIVSKEDVAEPVACIVFCTLSFDVDSDGDSGGFLEFWAEIDGVGVVAADPNPSYVMDASTDARLVFQFQFNVAAGQIWSVFFDANSNVSPVVDVTDTRLEIVVIRR